MSGYNLMIVDDHTLFRQGLKLLLRDDPIIDTIREACDGQDFLDQIELNVPDIVLIDIDMPGMDGITATRIAIEKYPELKVIALSMYGDEDYYVRMLDAGAKGFLLKNSEISDIENAIQHMIEGKSYFSQEILSGIINSLGRKKSSPQLLSDLTDREKEVLYHICKGLSNQEIADTLFLSKRTVDKHRENILLKTSSRNTASLVIYAIKHGIIKL